MYIYCIYTHRQTNFIHLSTFLRHFLIQFNHNGLFVVDTVSLLTERLYSTLILGRSVNILPFSIWTVSWPQSWNRSGELCYLIGATGRLIVTLVPYHPLFPVVFWQPDWIIVPNNCIICMPWWQTHSLQTGRLSASCIYFPLLAYFLIPSFIKHSGPLPPSILWWTQEGRIEFFQIIVSDRQPKAPFTSDQINTQLPAVRCHCRQGRGPRWPPHLTLYVNGFRHRRQLRVIIQFRWLMNTTIEDNGRFMCSTSSFQIACMDWANQRPTDQRTFVFYPFLQFIFVNMSKNWMYVYAKCET